MAPGADIARLRVDGDAAGLYRAVDSDDSATAYGAVALLGDLAAGDAAAVGLLLEIVRRPDVFRIGLRLRAASALGELREPRAVPALLAMLSPPERGTAEDVRRRRAVVGALARIGTPTVVTELIRRAAAGIDSPWVLPHALTRLRAPEAVPALLSALDRLPPGDPPAWVRLVRALGRQGDPRAGAALLGLLGTELPAPVVRREILKALDGLPAACLSGLLDPRAAALLRPDLRDPSPRTGPLAAGLLARSPAGRAELRGALEEAVRGGPGAGLPVTVVTRCLTARGGRPEPCDGDGGRGGGDADLLARLLRDAPAPLVRRHAAAALAAVGGARAVDALTAALGDERITEAVAEIVARLPDPPVDRLLALLTGDGAAARRGAAVALGRLGCAEAAPALLAAVDGVDPAGVRAAVDALGALRYRPAVPYLAVLAADTGEPGTVRARAVRALGLIGAAGALPVVLAAARDPRGVVRARAAQALGAFAVPEAAEALGALAAGDADPDVARAAARALGRIGAPALPVLGGLAARPRPDGGPLMDDVVDALAECPGGAADAVLNRLVTDLPPGPARVRATGALSGRRVPEAVPALAALLLDDREYAGHADALRGLAAIGGEPATGHVLAYCRRFPERLETARGALGLLARRAPAS